MTLETSVLLAWFILSIVALVAVLKQLARAIAIQAAIEKHASPGVKVMLKARVRDMAIFVPGAAVSLFVSGYLVWQVLFRHQPINWFLPTASNLFLLIVGGGVVLLHEIDDRRGEPLP